MSAPRFVPGAPFWMVCKAPVHAAARTEPRVRYATEGAAIAAARALAAEQDAAFLVLAVAHTIHPARAEKATGRLL